MNHTFQQDRRHPGYCRVDGCELPPSTEIHNVFPVESTPIRSISESYPERIEKETGRVVVKDWIQCDMCGGVGFSTYEPVCTKCDGKGQIKEFVYEDCSHLCESNECEENGCQLEE